MKCRKAYLSALLVVCVICINVLSLVVGNFLDEKGPVDIGSRGNISSMFYS